MTDPAQDPTASVADDFARLLPPFAMLRAFEVVGRVGGIRRAAAVLGLDHTVVSRHMRSLEARLGLTLFAREGARLRLTVEGAAYHARISPAIHELALATQAARGRGATRDLCLWSVPGFAAQWLSAQIADFERENGAHVELRPTDRRADLAHFEADIDIRFYGDDWGAPADTPGTLACELARPPLMIVASPDLAARLTLGGVEDLLAAPLLHEEDQQQWLAWLRGNGCAASAPLGGPLLWHAHLAVAAARGGRGLALANRFLVGGDLASGALVEVAVPGCSQVTVGSYRFVTRAERWHTAPIAALRAFLLARAGG